MMDVIDFSPTSSELTRHSPEKGNKRKRNVMITEDTSKPSSNLAVSKAQLENVRTVKFSSTLDRMESSRLAKVAPKRF